MSRLDHDWITMGEARKDSTENHLVVSLEHDPRALVAKCSVRAPLVRDRLLD
jgi:hypothetical protein